MLFWLAEGLQPALVFCSSCDIVACKIKWQESILPLPEGGGGSSWRAESVPSPQRTQPAHAAGSGSGALGKDSLIPVSMALEESLAVLVHFCGVFCGFYTCQIVSRCKTVTF